MSEDLDITSVKSGHGEDAKSVKSAHSNKSTVSTRTVLSVTLPNTTNAEQAKVETMIETGNSRPNSTQDDARTFSPGGTVPPVGTPTKEEATNQKPVCNDKIHEDPKRLRQLQAVTCIERAWLAYRDRQMFRLLKHAVCAAENSLSYEILRKVAPKEAEFLKDKFVQTKVRFRFGGNEFPPLIFFKIFSSGGHGMGFKYLSGKKMIRPASEAARDACDLMGARKFYDQMIQDALQQQTHQVADEIDVTTLKDYMQYLSLLDEMPCYMGGKDNFWRQLTLEVLPRQTIFYDVVEYLYSSKMSTRLKQEVPVLLANPICQEVQREHIRIISELRTTAYTPQQSAKMLELASRKGTGRRSKQAQRRVSRMRQMYEAQRDTSYDQEEPTDEEQMYYNADKLPPDGGRISTMMKGEVQEEYEEEDWEEEADRLYEWTQDLSVDEIISTPRLSTAATGGILV